MKAYLATVRTLNCLVALAAGALVILWSLHLLPPVPAGESAGTLWQGARRAAMLAAGAVLLLNLAGMLMRLREKSRRRYLVFEKEGMGSLEVAVDAIEETLMKCSSAIPEVQYVDIQMVLEKGGKMSHHAVVHCIFTDVPNLFAVQENVRQILTARYQEIFPGEDINFDIVVDRLKSGHEPHRRKEPKESKHREEPFGPRYPVER